MPDPIELDFGARDVANEVRDDLEDFVAGTPDRRTTTVELKPETPDPVLEMATGRAAVTREERATGVGGVGLTKGEKSRIDFTEVSPVAARQAKGKAAEKGVGDFVGAFDPTLSVEENEEIFEQASRETSGGRDAQPSVQERQAKAFKSSESNIMEHARKGVRHGSKQAEEELRRRGVDEAEIRQLKRGSAGVLDRRTKVLFPDVGEVTPAEWAAAKRSHEHRRVEAQRSDESKSADTVVSDFDKWRKNRERFDFPGVDTQRSVRSYLEPEKADEFSELTSDLWKWQD